MEHQVLKKEEVQVQDEVVLTRSMGLRVQSRRITCEVQGKASKSQNKTVQISVHNVGKHSVVQVHWLNIN